jgi:hypothetical protein
MSARAEIEAGICGFRTTVEARSEDYQNVTFSLQTDCEKVRALSAQLQAMEPVDAYQEIRPGSPGPMMRGLTEGASGCCAGCVVPLGIFKAMQVAAGLSLPRHIALRIEGGA